MGYDEWKPVIGDVPRLSATIVENKNICFSPIVTDVRRQIATVM
jgi:hypothetical protein